MTAHVIYRGTVKREPDTINLPVAAALLPGSLVTSNGSALSLAANSFGRLLLLSNRRFYTQTDTDAYVADETAIAYRLEVEEEYRAILAAATYAHGAALTWTGTAFAAATAGTKVLAFYDGAGETLAADGLADIVIANSYIQS